MRRRRGQGTVTRRKDGRYEAAVYVNTPVGNKRVRRYAPTQPEAETILVDLRKKHIDGLLTDTRERKLGEYLDYWLTITKNRVSANTYLSYEATVRLYLKPGLGQKTLTKLSVNNLQSFLDNQLEKGISVRNIQKQKVVLLSVFKKAEQEELLSRNPARLIQIPQYKSKEIVPWDLSQLQTFLGYAASDPLYPVFVFLSLYGLRTSEALGLSWSDIDFSKKVIHVRQQLQYHEKTYHYADLKTQAGRRELPLLEITDNLLKNISRSDTGSLPDLVFKTKTGMPIDRRNLLRSFQRISNHAGLPIIALHHLRHTAATILKDIGTPARDTQLILGHAHITTTQQIYQHSDVEGRYLILEQYEQKLVSVSAYSRQIKPSSDLDMPNFNKANIGSGGWARTTDLRLMSPVL